jgi:hypothetical protein
MKTQVRNIHVHNRNFLILNERDKYSSKRKEKKTIIGSERKKSFLILTE